MGRVTEELVRQILIDQKEEPISNIEITKKLMEEEDLDNQKSVIVSVSRILVTLLKNGEVSKNERKYSLTKKGSLRQVANRILDPPYPWDQIETSGLVMSFASPKLTQLIQERNEIPQIRDNLAKALEDVEGDFSVIINKKKHLK